MDLTGYYTQGHDMSISLDSADKKDLEDAGAIVDSSTLGGELQGTISSATLANLRGIPISNTAVQEYQGYIRFDGELKPINIVWQTLDTTGGTVQGNFDEGLNLKSIYGSSLVDGQLFNSDGQGIAYRGGELYVTQLNPYEIRYINSNVTANPRDDIRVDCSISGSTITCGTLSESESFVVRVLKGDAQTNSIRLEAVSIEGDTFYLLDRNADILVYNDGTEFKVKELARHG